MFRAIHLLQGGIAACALASFAHAGALPQEPAAGVAVTQVAHAQATCASCHAGTGGGMPNPTLQSRQVDSRWMHAVGSAGRPVAAGGPLVTEEVALAAAYLASPTAARRGGI
ncbi:hypothetical protein [Aquincola agrisoli]